MTTSIYAYAIQGTQVTLLAMIWVDHAVTAAGYPSRITAIRRCVRRPKKTCI